MRDDYWRCYTYDRYEANKYRFESREENFYAKKTGVTYTKYVNLFYYDKKNKVYWLPPVTWRDKKCEEHKIEVKEIIKLRELQQKTIDEVSNMIDNWIESVMAISEVGTWKSYMWLWFIKRFSRRTLVIVPNKTIWEWWYDKLKDYCDCKFMDWNQFRKSEKLPDVLVMHRQSVVNCWNQINWQYDLLIDDEWHHLSDTKKMLVNTWKWFAVISLTGTPERKDMNTEDFKLYYKRLYETWLKSLPVRVLTYKYHHVYSMKDWMKACEWYNPESVEPVKALVNNNDDRYFHLKKIVKDLYYQCWLKRFIVFIDRIKAQEKVKELFPNAYIINWDSDKKKVIEEVKNKDEFLIIGMVTASGEGFDIPSIQCWILFYSTDYPVTLTQMAWRAKRFSEGKDCAYWVDFQHTAKIEPNVYKNFGYKKRLEWYKEQWFQVMSLDEYIKSLNNKQKLF